MMASGASGTDLLLSSSHFARFSGLTTLRMSGVDHDKAVDFVRPGPCKERCDQPAIGMGDEHIRAGFARRRQQPMEIVRRLVGRMRLGDRRGLIRSVKPHARAVIGAYAGEAGHHRKYRRLALVQKSLAPGHGVIIGNMGRVGRIEGLAPVCCVVALARDKHDRRRSCTAAFEIHLATAANVHEAREVPSRGLHDEGCERDGRSDETQRIPKRAQKRRRKAEEAGEHRLRAKFGRMAISLPNAAHLVKDYFVILSLFS